MSGPTREELFAKALEYTANFAMAECCVAHGIAMPVREVCCRQQATLFLRQHADALEQKLETARAEALRLERRAEHRLVMWMDCSDTHVMELDPLNFETLLAQNETRRKDALARIAEIDEELKGRGE